MVQCRELGFNVISLQKILSRFDGRGLTACSTFTHGCKLSSSKKRTTLKRKRRTCTWKHCAAEQSAVKIAESNSPETTENPYPQKWLLCIYGFQGYVLFSAFLKDPTLQCKYSRLNCSLKNSLDLSTLQE